MIANEQILHDDHIEVHLEQSFTDIRAVKLIYKIQTMTEAEEHNKAIFEAFRKDSEAKGSNSKIFCILSIDKEGIARIFQSAMYSPKQIADRLFKIGNGIIEGLKNNFTQSN